MTGRPRSYLMQIDCKRGFVKRTSNNMCVCSVWGTAMSTFSSGLWSGNLLTLINDLELHWKPCSLQATHWGKPKKTQSCPQNILSHTAQRTEGKTAIECSLWAMSNLFQLGSTYLCKVKDMFIVDLPGGNFGTLVGSDYELRISHWESQYQPI